MKPGETPNPPVESCLLIVGKIAGTISNGTLMLNTVLSVLGKPHQ